MLVSHEFEDLGAPIGPRGRCGHTEENSYIRMWSGGIECAFYIDVKTPTDNVYNVEIVGWSIGQHELYGEDGFAKLAVDVNP